MTERLIDPQTLEAKARKIVTHLKEVATEHERAYSSYIQAVLVFSGPGTYYDRLKPGQDEWQRWIDRDRIRAGVAIVREITASKVSEVLSLKVKSCHVSKENVAKFGPYFVYNGIPVENNNLRKAINSPFCKLAAEKVIIIDQVLEKDGTSHPIRHTGDQVKSFYQQTENPKSPLFGIRNVALVAHIPHYIRIPFYIKKYNDQALAKGQKGLIFWVFGIKTRAGVEQVYINWELSRLVKYAQTQDLATEPARFLT